MCSQMRHAAVALLLAGLSGDVRAVQDVRPPPSFYSVRAVEARVPRFGRMELSIQLQTSATRPYYPYGPVDDGYVHPDGVTVDAHVTQPDGTTVIVPAFFHTPYARAPVDPTHEAIGIAGSSEWRVRFTPHALGAHRAVVSAVDADGQAMSSPIAFTVDASDRRGFIRTSPTDPRFLSYDNGDDFVPIAEGRQWAPMASRVTLSYQEAFARDAASGVNLTRVWDQNDGFNVALEGSYPVWAPSWSQFTTALGIDLEHARSGRRAARFRVSSRATSEGYVQHVVVRPSTTYTLAGWIRTSALTGGGAFLSADAGSYLEPGSIRTDTLKGTQDWTHVRTTFTTEKSQEATRIWVGAATSSGSAWFDDVTLIPADASFNVLSDAGFERHFPRGDVGNDPEDPHINRTTVPKGTEINQWAAYQIDRILDAADALGIAVQLCSHGDVYWTWDATIYTERYATANGYTTPWLDPKHLGYWKRNMRYRIARWGYSPAVLAWEVWNEHGNIPVPSELHAFYQALGRFVADLDPFDHFFTTSQGSQAYSPEFWTTTPTGLVNYHDYMTTALRRHPAALTEDAAAFVYALAGDLIRQWPPRSPRKPFIWGEIGTLTTWDVDDPIATAGVGGEIARHNLLWAGLFSQVFTSPIDWQRSEKSASTRALRRYFDGEPYSRSHWRTYATADLASAADAALEATPAALRVVAIVSQARTRLLAWLQHRDHTWAKVARDGQRPVPFIGTFTTPELAAGSYRVEWWNTRTGVVMANRTVEHVGGTLAVTSPVAIADDIAIKVFQP